MTTYERPPAQNQYPLPMPAPQGSGPPQHRSSVSQGYVPNPSYDPNVPQQNFAPEQRHRRQSSAAGSPRPAFATSAPQGYFQYPGYDSGVPQPNLTPETARRRSSAASSPRPGSAPYASQGQPIPQPPTFQPNYHPQRPYPGPPPQQYQQFGPSSYPGAQYAAPPPHQTYPPAGYNASGPGAGGYFPQAQQSPMLHPSSAYDPDVTFDDGTYERGYNRAYAQRPRAYSSSSQQSRRRHRSSSGAIYPDDEAVDGRRHSASGSTHSSGPRSHHSYSDPPDRKHYHGRDKRPTYGDSILLAWDSIKDLLSSRRD